MSHDAPPNRFGGMRRSLAALGLACLAMALTSCGGASRRYVSKIRVAGKPSVVSGLRACLEEPCAAQPRPGVVRPKSTWDLLWAPDEAPKGKACPKGELPRVVDVDCNPVPLSSYAIWRDADGRPSRFEAQVLREKGIPHGYKYFAGEAVKWDEAQKLTTRELVDIYRTRRGLRPSNPAALQKARSIFPESTSGMALASSRTKPYCGASPEDAVLVLLERSPDYEPMMRAELVDDGRPRRKLESKQIDKVLVEFEANPLLRQRWCDSNPLCDSIEESDTAVTRVARIANFTIERMANLLEQASPMWSAANPLRIRLAPSDSYGYTSPRMDHVVIDPQVFERPENAPASLDWGVIPHEIFHRVQYTHQRETRGPFRPALIEGTAVWAEDLIHPDYNHYVAAGVHFLAGISNTPALAASADRSRREDGESSSAGYSVGLLWKYVEEQSGGGSGAFARGFLAAIHANRFTLDAVSAITRTSGGLDEVWVSFLLANALHGKIDHPRFAYRDASDPVLWPDFDRRLPSLSSMRASAEVVDRLPDDLLTSAWSGHYFLLKPPSIPTRTTMSFSWLGAGRAPIVAVLPVDVDAHGQVVRAGGQVTRIASAATVEVRSALLIVVAAREGTGKYRLDAETVR